MKLALCDDDRKFIQELRTTVLQYADSHGLELGVDEYLRGKDLINSREIYDMVLLDYQMEDLDGLDVAKRLREKNINCAIMFITAYPNFVYEAFEVSAFRFYEKPLNIAKLYTGLDDYFKMYGNDSTLLVCHNGKTKTVKVNTKDIVFVEAMNDTCVIHLANEKIDRLDCYNSLAELSKSLSPNHFYKVSRFAVVNFNYIDKYTNEEILFKNGKKAQMSRRRWKDFKDAFMEYSVLGYIKVKKNN